MKEPALQVKTQDAVAHQALVPLKSVALSRASIHPTLQLQRMVGNQATQHFIQGKLSISQPDDPYEEEAKRVAEHVMSPSAPDISETPVRRRNSQEDEMGQIKPLAASITPIVSRAQSGPLSERVERPPEFESRLRSGGEGRPLPIETRIFMERRFGTDFSRVRLHSGDEAAQLNRDISALAFTHGRNVYLGEGQDHLGTSSGKRLLAHELTHVVQQDRSTRPLTQRWTAPLVSLKSDEELIRDACGPDQDITAIKEIRDINKATEAQKLTMLGLLVNQSVVGFRDNNAIRRIWGSLGGRLVEAANANMALWKRSVSCQSDAGQNDMKQLPDVKALREQFPKDIRAIVDGYLNANQATIEEEMRKLGIAGEEKDQRSQTSEQTDEMTRLQEALRQIGDAQAAREALKGVYVGYDYVYDPTVGRSPDPLGGGERKSLKPAAFNPTLPPASPPKGGDEPRMQPYDKVRDAYDDLSTKISVYMNRYPAAYAVVSIGEGESAVTNQAANAKPAEAQKLIGDSMRTMLKNIEKTKKKINEDDFLLELKPIHMQMFSGGAPAGKKTWKTDSLGHWAATQVIQNKEEMDFYITLGLGSLAAAAFIFAEIATVGTATFFIAAGVGLAASGAEVSQLWGKYGDLAAAGKTNVSDKTALVDPEMVDEAMMEASITTALTILAVVGIAAKGLNVLRGVKAPAIDFTKQLAATGEKGSLAGRQGFGVFEGRLPWVQKPVAIKVYPESLAAKFEQDLAGARAASASGGPKCYGEIPAGPGKRAFAMEKIEGGFTTTAPTGKETAAELLAMEKEAKLFASKVTSKTVEDVEAYSARLLKNGNYYNGEVQGLVDAQGRWRPIDFQPITRLPADPSSVEYAQAIQKHREMFKLEIEQMTKLAAANSPKVP